MRYRSSTSVVSPRHGFSTRRRLAATDADDLLDLVPVAVMEMVRGPDGRHRIAYFNRGASIAWKNKAGDWTDAKGKAQGTVPFAQAPLTNQGAITHLGKFTAGGGGGSLRGPH